MDRLDWQKYAFLAASLYLGPLALEQTVAAPNSLPDVATYQKQVAPLLTKYCYDCHGPDANEGNLQLHQIDPNLQTGDGLETWRMVYDQLRYGDMPPKDADQLPSSDRTQLTNWIRKELWKTQLPGTVSQEKLLLPQFGNYVDHEFLFGKRLPMVYPTQPRIWRLRPDIYNTIVPRLGERVSGLANALNSLDGSEFKDYAAVYFWTKLRLSSS